MTIGNGRVGLFPIHPLACSRWAHRAVRRSGVFGQAAISFEATGDDFAATGLLWRQLRCRSLAFKGFTTITNSGAEITDPHRNVGRAIIWAIAICCRRLSAGGLLRLAPALPLNRIVRGGRTTRWPRPPSLRSVRPASYLTVALALVGHGRRVLIASVFAVSRMLAMLTNMEMIPHSHFGMPGTIKDHHARLHRRDRGLPDGLLRSQPHRLARGLLLSGDGHDHPLRRVPGICARKLARKAGCC